MQDITWSLVVCTDLHQRVELHTFCKQKQLSLMRHTGSVSRQKSGRGVDNPPTPSVRLLKKSRIELLLLLWAFMACYRANCSFYFLNEYQQEGHLIQIIHQYYPEWKTEGTQDLCTVSTILKTIQTLEEEEKEEETGKERNK